MSLKTITSLSLPLSHYLLIPLSITLTKTRTHSLLPPISLFPLSLSLSHLIPFQLIHYLKAAMDKVAKVIGQPAINVYEVAKIGRAHV